VVSLLKVAEAEMMVAARVDGGWIAVESEKAFTKLLKIILRIVAMKRMCRMEPRSWIMDDERAKKTLPMTDAQRRRSAQWEEAVSLPTTCKHLPWHLIR
jgi:hypothetical protein